MDDHFAEAGAIRGEPSPEPDGEIFECRIFQAFDVVEAAVIELVDDFPRGLADFRMVIEPAHFRVHLALDRNFHAETVAVHPSAFVPRRHVRQNMGRLETEIPGQSNFHLKWNGLLNAAPCWFPDQLVKLQLKAGVQLVLEHPVHDFNRLDATEDGGK